MKAEVKQITAYGVHLFTAIGAGLGFWALLLTYQGHLQSAMWVLALTVAIDGIDGSLARLLNVKTQADKVDGSLLDNIIDYLTWTIVPLFWIYMGLSLPPWILGICAVASVLGFSNTRAKTADNYFLGFPSYWNIVVLYLYVMEFSVTGASIVLLICAALIFVPIKFIYPSRTPFLKRFTLTLGLIYFAQLILLVWYFESSSALLIYSSFIFPIYYAGLSLYLQFVRPKIF